MLDVVLRVFAGSDILRRQQLVLVGDGMESDVLRRLADELGVSADKAGAALLPPLGREGPDNRTSHDNDRPVNGHIQHGIDAPCPTDALS